MKKHKKSIKHKFEQEEISIRLNSYEDLFSGFDPRNYSERSLSQDYLEEMHRAVHDSKENQFELILMIPKNKRNKEQEKIIKNRLWEHFNKHYLQLKKESKITLIKGIIITILGFLLMIFASYIYLNNGKNLIYSVIVVCLEPSGWFSVWYGLDTIFYLRNNKELKFYQKMSKANIQFLDIK